MIKFSDMFRENFSFLKNEKITVYGIGFLTKQLFEEGISDFNITALLDGFKTDGTFCGLPIIPIEDIDTKIIVIIANTGATKIIYKRIADFCNENQITVYDLYANVLTLTENKSFSYHPYFDLSYNSLIAEIDSHEAISFDIFDTLITRKTLFPDDVLDIIENRQTISFKKDRITALRRLLCDTDPNFDEIYGQLDINSEYEIETERELLICRDDMVKAFNYAVSSGKKVCLISDMYFSRQQIEKFLSDLGIKGYTDIFVSCEYRTSKNDKLFEIYKNKIQAENYLHIGDSPEADGLSAQQNGIDSFLIKNPADMLEISRYSDILKSDNLKDRVIAGLFASKIFNSPFNMNDKKLSAFDIGYFFIAPIVSEFMIWLFGQLENSDISHILFGARDGYIIEKIYRKAVLDWHLKMPEPIYFLTSRSVCIASSMMCEDDILYALSHPFDGSPDSMLEKRFFLDKTDIKPYSKQDLKDYILAHKEQIIKRSEDIRTNYYKYIDTLDIKNKKLAYFDFVSSGTCHLALNKIISDMQGFYFTHHFQFNSYKENLKIKDSFPENGIFDNNYYILENIFSYDMPTLLNFDDNGNPIFYPEKRTVSQIDFMKEVHNGILNWFDDLLKIFPSAPISDDKKISEFLLKYLSENISDMTGCYYDEFPNREIMIKDL